jgi:hypothetical protein
VKTDEEVGAQSFLSAAAAHPGYRWGAAFVVLFALPLAIPNGYQQYLLDLIMINVVLAVGLNIVKGFAGQVNVGHVALAAIGAYTSAVLSTKFGLPFWFALPLATLATGVVGAIVGVPSFRLEGAYLALATLGPPNPCGSSLPSRTISARRSGTVTSRRRSLPGGGSTLTQRITTW